MPRPDKGNTLTNRIKGIGLVLPITLLASSLLSGCAALVVGGVGVSAVTMSEDKRTIGTQIDDATTDAKIENAISKVEELKENSNISVHVYNGTVLLLGQTPNGNLRIKAEQAAATVPNIRKIHNQIRIGSPTAATTKAYDVWLASKVRANLLSDKEVDFLKIDVAVEDSEVFLMGLVTQTQADKAIEITRNIDGVVKVINVFEIL
ncbi:BON domain-containing protein [Paraneptunicella aestuarii]|uniref:BON domain-containing protein n=1 Tax=Paraneptunicella aestuarii TaxID=2831148 RepID=UPI001E30EF6C|nr:BON domain-containing protein [Paraneptunicella aestuarii]UAA38427.1 BON domain-containing protein [Paraneptunicella aestuarii]